MNQDAPSSEIIDKIADEDYANRENWHLASIFVIWAVLGFFAGFDHGDGPLDQRLAAGIIDAVFFGAFLTAIGAGSHWLDRRNSRKRAAQGIAPRKKGWANTVWIIIVTLMILMNGLSFLQTLKAVT